MANLAFNATIEVTNGQTDRRVNKTRVGGFMSTLFMIIYIFFSDFLPRVPTSEGYTKFIFREFVERNEPQQAHSVLLLTWKSFK